MNKKTISAFRSIRTIMFIRIIQTIQTLWTKWTKQTILTKRTIWTIQTKRTIWTIQTILFSFFINPATFSQYTSFADSSIEQDLKNEGAGMREVLSANYNGNPLIKGKIIEFSLDTFLIEKELELKLGIIGNLFDKELALNDAVYAYNRLVGKYLDLLNSYLDETDQKTLQQSQMSWLEHKRHEFGLLEKIARKPYPGGNTIDDVYITQRVKEMNKSRVGELFRYSLFMELKNEK